MGTLHLLHWQLQLVSQYSWKAGLHGATATWLDELRKADMFLPTPQCAPMHGKPQWLSWPNIVLGGANHAIRKNSIHLYCCSMRAYNIYIVHTYTQYIHTYICLNMLFFKLLSREAPSSWSKVPLSVGIQTAPKKRPGHETGVDSTNTCTFFLINCVNLLSY